MSYSALLLLGPRTHPTADGKLVQRSPPLGRWSTAQVQVVPYLPTFTVNGIGSYTKGKIIINMKNNNNSVIIIDASDRV